MKTVQGHRSAKRCHQIMYSRTVNNIVKAKNALAIRDDGMGIPASDHNDDGTFSQRPTSEIA